MQLIMALTMMPLLRWCWMRHEGADEKESKDQYGHNRTLAKSHSRTIGLNH